MGQKLDKPHALIASFRLNVVIEMTAGLVHMPVHVIVDSLLVIVHSPPQSVYSGRRPRLQAIDLWAVLVLEKDAAVSRQFSCRVHLCRKQNQEVLLSWLLRFID